MRRTAVTILLAAALGVLHAGFFAALPAPASALHLPLMFVIGLIFAFRFADAFAAAAASGIVLDALSSLPFGVNLAVMLIVTAFAMTLFTRVFTNHSWTGLLGMNAAAYLFLHAAFGTARLGRAVFAGWPATEAVFHAAPAVFAAALLVQIAAVVLAAVVGRRFKAAFAAFFFTR